MIQFQYQRVNLEKAAVSARVKDKNSMFIAGGTNLLDLMKRGIVSPEKLIDISRIPGMAEITAVEGGIRIGALALNTKVAEDKLVLGRQPLLALAINAGASAQIRNMATVGGNMLQRTRCSYFYDKLLPCNKREPGSGCGALDGFNRMHAIFGFSEQCIAVHPSDMSVALTALDATVRVLGPGGSRTIPFGDFHRLPGTKPEVDTNLGNGELITYVELPDSSFNHVHYLKIRDRASYAFALVSVAVALHIENNTIKEARLAMGGVAHKPWRLKEAEASLAGKTASDSSFRQAAEIAMAGAKAFKHNEYKLRMAPNAIVQALKSASGI